MKKLDIVITMGGLGYRFREAGYSVPKYMIEARGKTLFEWSLLSLTEYSEIANQYIFIVRQEEKNDVNAFIREKCDLLGIKEYQIKIINYLTDGQASTAMIGNEYWKEGNGLLIYNIDTYVESGVLAPTDIRGDGFIPCFLAEGEHWSFVKTDKDGKAIEVKEKQRISNNCTLGAYYFKTCKLYEDLYHEYYCNGVNEKKGERYVAPLYNLLIAQKGEVYISLVDWRKVHVLGTPKELEAFINSKVNILETGNRNETSGIYTSA